MSVITRKNQTERIEAIHKKPKKNKKAKDYFMG